MFPCPLRGPQISGRDKVFYSLILANGFALCQQLWPLSSFFKHSLTRVFKLHLNLTNNQKRIACTMMNFILPPTLCHVSKQLIFFSKLQHTFTNPHHAFGQIKHDKLSTFSAV